jgi:RNA polymerase sigma-70 factor (ECF subfamily)
MSHSATDPTDERALLLAARAGDECAFGQLVGRYRRGLEQFCYLMLGNRHDAAGAVEETVLRAWLERELAESAAPVKMWLYRIAISECLGECDRRR